MATFTLCTDAPAPPARKIPRATKKAAPPVAPKRGPGRPRKTPVERAVEPVAPRKRTRRSPRSRDTFPSAEKPLGRNKRRALVAEYVEKFSPCALDELTKMQFDMEDVKALIGADTLFLNWHGQIEYVPESARHQWDGFASGGDD